VRTHKGHVLAQKPHSVIESFAELNQLGVPCEVRLTVYRKHVPEDTIHVASPSRLSYAVFGPHHPARLRLLVMGAAPTRWSGRRAVAAIRVHKRNQACSRNHRRIPLCALGHGLGVLHIQPRRDSVYYINYSTIKPPCQALCTPFPRQLFFC
jgi:hypothetical protein